MSTKLIRCSRICVDCVKNTDIVDIMNGGPETLGFDFDVDQTKYNEMVEYVKCSLKELKVPVMDIKYGGLYMVEERYVFDKQKIFGALSRSSDYLIKESKRVLQK